jgi:hypothetical protein
LPAQNTGLTNPLSSKNPTLDAGDGTLTGLRQPRQIAVPIQKNRRLFCGRLHKLQAHIFENQ